MATSDNPVFKDKYPHWPWVDLGQDTANPENSIRLPETMRTKELLESINAGSKLAHVMQGTVHEAYRILVDDFNFPKAPRFGQQVDQPTA